MALQDNWLFRSPVTAEISGFKSRQSRLTDEVTAYDDNIRFLAGSNPAHVIMGEYTVGVAGQSVKLMASVTDSSTLSSPTL